ncbi:putative RNA-binding Zn ribbon-like protein [Diaminobutyricimonas aerilata]|uniref:Putative RNA-binding Zn ribbon-like protein n=1 Tax=Diaminobutyricimonas aerilata TaxID=1162967 RepID=A0A2M9CNM2_9MICO|nr:putative RNA-binding Zn ribbon-like protein [Diaminobutyricimonas aerilata]
MFTHDTVDALVFLAALVNTTPTSSDSETEELSTVAELEVLLDAHGYFGRRDGTIEELQEVQALREVFRELWALPTDDAVPVVNRMLADAGALPQLVRHDAQDWHIHAVGFDAPLATRILVEGAMAFVDVIRTEHRDRLRVCAADRCDTVLLDQSRNGSRRFCSDGCANRTHVSAYRARKAARV